MTLAKAGLETDIAAALNSADSTALKAADWGTACGDYAADVVPAANGPAVVAAGAALGASLATAFANTVQATGVAAAEAAFLTFGTSVGAAMAPAFTATPPAGAVGWAAIFAATYTSTGDSAADAADAIDTWMKTGTATPSGGGAPVNWS